VSTCKDILEVDSDDVSNHGLKKKTDQGNSVNAGIVGALGCLHCQDKQHENYHHHKQQHEEEEEVLCRGWISMGQKTWWRRGLTEVTLYSPGMVKALWLSYCPTWPGWPAISWYVDVMMKSAQITHAGMVTPHEWQKEPAANAQGDWWGGICEAGLWLPHQFQVVIW